MLKKTLYFFIIQLVFALPTFAQLASYDEVIEGDINSDLTLTASKKYLLRGFVNVNAPASITIPAGTIIYGEKESKGSLIINRGAKIFAEGTKEKPIVFTSQMMPGQRGAGDWGGIIIVGNATLNVPGGTATIEGGTGTVMGGGTSPNDDESSGIIKYIRIEFPGIAFLPDNEINGLTMGGVGRNTVIDYVQVSYSGDDSFEWFGGTVNAKHLISYYPVDDNFDTDFGFTGKVQFAMSFANPNMADISGSNGFESDNDGSGTLNSPRTQPLFSNVTVVGPLVTPDFTGFNSNYKRAAHLRRSTLTSIYNSIIMGYPTGLYIQSQNSANDAIAGNLQIQNTIIAGSQSGKLLTTDVSGFDIASWFNNSNNNNRTFATSAEVGLTDPFKLDSPDATPQSGSVALVGASFTNSRLLDPFFTPTTFVGALDANERWDLGWANYDPQNTDYTITDVEEKLIGNIPSDFSLSQNYPNPFNPSTKIKFSIPEAGHIKISIFNLLGEEVDILFDGFKNAGVYEINWTANNLSSGIYFYILQSNSATLIKKMSLLR